MNTIAFNATGLAIGANTVKASIVFMNQVTNEPIVTIKPDGSIEVGEGATADDAARAFWAGVEAIRPSQRARARANVLRDQIVGNLSNVIAEMLTVARGPGGVDTGYGTFSVDNCIKVFDWMKRLEEVAGALLVEVES